MGCSSAIAERKRDVCVRDEIDHVQTAIKSSHIQSYSPGGQVGVGKAVWSGVSSAPVGPGVATVGGRVSPLAAMVGGRVSPCVSMVGEGLSTISVGAGVGAGLSTVSVGAGLSTASVGEAVGLSVTGFRVGALEGLALGLFVGLMGLSVGTELLPPGGHLVVGPHAAVDV